MSEQTDLIETRIEQETAADRRVREESRASKILVAEDRAARFAEMKLLLEAKGYTIIHAETLSEMHTKLGEENPALLIMSEKFANGDGIESCRGIKDRIGFTTLPIIFIIESGKPETWHHAKAAGADEFLNHPIVPRDLSSRVRRVLGLNILFQHIAPSPARKTAVEKIMRAKKACSLLLVEDDKDQRQLLKKRLESAGHAVRTAENGVQALDAVAEAPPELIISDVNMPEMDGFELCRRVKSDEKTKSIPLIITTSMDDDKSRRLGYEAGADDYVNKPVNTIELEVRIHTLARIRMLREPSAEMASEEKPVEKTLREMNPLELWFHWQTRLAASPELRELRRRVADEISLFLEKRHDYKVGLFFDADAKGGDVKKAYSEIRQSTEKRIREVIREQAVEVKALMTAHEQEMLLKGEIFDRFAFGPIQPLLDHPHITDILIGRFNDIHIEMRGNLLRTPIRFDSEAHLKRIMDAILRYSGREINEMKPYVEARLRDGSRVSATIPPLSIDGATLTIRKFVVRRMELDDLLQSGTLSVEMAALLDLLVRAGCNIIVSGSTGAGKTTLLNLLGSCIPISERIITVEDTAELRLRHKDIIPEMMQRERLLQQVPAINMERFEARESNLDGVSVTIRDIIKLALRKRPDRIVVGEVRGGEALDMLNAMNTGHRGCLTTIHANNTSDLMVRLENMVIEANSALPLNAVQRMIVAAINIAVQVVKFADNTRRITEITEITGYDLEKNEIQLRQLFVYDPGALGSFVYRNPPSPRLKGIVEEYLMKTGEFRPHWDAAQGEVQSRSVMKMLFRRSLGAFFPEFLFQGASDEEKTAARASAFDFIADEVFRWDSSIEIEANAGDAFRETMRVALSDAADHAMLNKVRKAALWKLAQRLNLPENEWKFVVESEMHDKEKWEIVFPKESGREKSLSEKAPVYPGKGISFEDLQQAFFNVIGELKTKLGRGIDYDLDPARYKSRIERLSTLIPYVKLSILDPIEADTESLMRSSGAAGPSGKKFVVEPMLLRKKE